jgi:hypothetical protein
VNERVLDFEKLDGQSLTFSADDSMWTRGSESFGHGHAHGHGHGIRPARDVEKGETRVRALW